MRKALFVIGFSMCASAAVAQPATPCNPNSGSWSVSTSSAVFYVCASDGLSWLTVGGGGSSVPQGSILLILSGACPTGFEEATELNGQTLVGTLAANKDVGTTGGNDSITPAGTNSGTAIADHASHTHTYTQVVNHTHGFTNVRGATTGGATTARGFTEGNDTSSTVTTQLTADPGGGVASGTTAGPGAALTHTVSTQPVFAGTPADNRSAFTRVIFCRKT